MNRNRRAAPAPNGKLSLISLAKLRGAVPPLTPVFPVHCSMVISEVLVIVTLLTSLETKGRVNP